MKKRGSKKGGGLERKWWTLIAVCLAIFMLLLDITIVNVALPQIQDHLHASFTDLQWVIDAYALTLATVVLNAGSLADRYGRKRLFMGGLVIFTLASLLCGASVSPLMLILCRALQGIGGAILFSTSLSLLAQDFHGRDRGTAFGIWGAVTGAAVAIGPLVGGILTQALSWRWIFYVNLPIGIGALILTYYRVRESRNTHETKTDWAGVVLLSGALFTLVLLLLKANAWGWGSGSILGLIAASAILLVGFIANEYYRSQPVFDLKLFRIPSFVGAQVAAIGISASIFSMFLYITLYFQNVLGYSPLQAGLRLLPTSLLSFVMAAAAGRMSAKVPTKLLIGVGLLCIGVGLLLCHGVTVDSAWTRVLPGLILCGFGIGLVNPPLASVAIGVVQPQQSGMASGVNSTFRQVGIAAGIAALGTISVNSVQNHLSQGLQNAHLSHQALTGLSQGVASGQIGSAAQAAPEQYRAAFSALARQSFISALNELFLITAVVALISGFLVFFLIHRRDLAVYDHHTVG